MVLDVFGGRRAAGVRIAQVRCVLLLQCERRSPAPDPLPRASSDASDGGRNSVRRNRLAFIAVLLLVSSDAMSSVLGSDASLTRADSAVELYTADCRIVMHRSLGGQLARPAIDADRDIGQARLGHLDADHIGGIALRIDLDGDRDRRAADRA